MGPDDKLANRLVEAENACMRGKDLTYQLLAFARGGGPMRKATDLVALVRQSAISTVTEPKINLSFSFPDDLFPLTVDEEQICQVIGKMVSNAQEAMEEGGTLWIGAENVAIGPASGLTLRQGDYVRISIRDKAPASPRKIFSGFSIPISPKNRWATKRARARPEHLLLHHQGPWRPDHGGL